MKKEPSLSPSGSHPSPSAFSRSTHGRRALVVSARHRICCPLSKLLWPPLLWKPACCPVRHRNRRRNRRRNLQGIKVKGTKLSQKRKTCTSWAGLPQDLLHLIALNLPNPHDFCRFGAICTSWHEAAVQSGEYTPKANGVPWFMMPLIKERPMSGIRFLDPSTARCHELHLVEPGLQPKSGMFLAGAGHGWVVIHDAYTKEMWLLNPLTKAQINLPPFTSSRGVCRVSLSGSPTSGNCMVLIHEFGDWWQVTIGAATCDQWARIDGACNFVFNFAVHYKGQFYAISSWCALYVIAEDINQDGLTLNNKIYKKIYLAVGEKEMFVCIILEPRANEQVGGKWEVYRVDENKHHAREEELDPLIRVESLGDGAIFISQSSSVYVSRMPSNDAGCKCKRNSIYYHRAFDPMGPETIIWEYSLEDGMTRPFFRYKSGGRGNIYPSVWVVPSS